MNIELDMTKIVGFGGIVFAEVLAIYWILKDRKSLDALKRCDFRSCDSETLVLIAFVPLSVFSVVIHFVHHGFNFVRHVF